MPDRTWLVIGHAKLAVTFLAHAQAGHGLFSVMSKLTMTVMLLMPSWPWLLCALRLCALLLPGGFAHCFCPEALCIAFAWCCACGFCSENEGAHACCCCFCLKLLP